MLVVLAVGIVALCVALNDVRDRIVGSFIYAVAMTTFLVWYSFGVVCGAFDQCL